MNSVEWLATHADNLLDVKKLRQSLAGASQPGEKRDRVHCAQRGPQCLLEGPTEIAKRDFEGDMIANSVQRAQNP